jgi:8-oxo-dGTP pyrophosphatase MutT (NUDIX family)
MPNQQPVVESTRGRPFACSPAAVVAYVVDDAGRVLLLSSPKTPGAWEVVNGVLEAGETLLEGALRETREEAGPRLRVRPLGTVHALTFHYDDNVQFMISVAFLLAYEGGPVEPGDDMAGADYRWWSLDELRAERPLLLVPGNDQFWLIERAVELHRLWRDVPLPSVPHPSGGRN